VFGSFFLALDEHFLNFKKKKSKKEKRKEKKKN